VHLPASAALSTWFEAARSGTATLDRVATRTRGDAPHCIVVDPAGQARSLEEALAEWFEAGVRMTAALPVPGDPCGLGGPSAFNHAALDAGEAVVLNGIGLGLVPHEDARTLVLSELPAVPAPYADGHEAARELRAALLASTSRLAQLDVASWQPEVADLLMNLRHRPAPDVPSHWDARRAETLDRALLCRDIVALALVDEGGAVSAHEMAQRRSALRDLDAAARRALVAVCSDSLVSP
jgi:hypothetical protein